MKIAILLSGRVKKYKSFLNFLNNYKDIYEIDLFISVNDNYSIFYDKLKEDFKYFLKDINISIYNLPNNLNNVHMMKYWFTYRTLSMLYNDNLCYKMASQYSNKNNIIYDIYLRTRSDIICNEFPFEKIDFKNSINETLFCVNPIYKFTLALTDNPEGEFINGRYHCYGDVKHHGKFVTADIAFGNKENMKKYCDCYDYVLQKNEEYKGNYFICFEYSITTYLEDININWVFFDFEHSYCSNRENYEIV